MVPFLEGLKYFIITKPTGKGSKYDIDMVLTPKTISYAKYNAYPNKDKKNYSKNGQHM